MATELIRVGNALDFGDLPLSAAVRIGGTVHTAGVLPIDPVTGELVGETALGVSLALPGLKVELQAVAS